MLLKDGGALLGSSAFLLFHSIPRCGRAVIGFKHLKLRLIRTCNQNGKLECLPVGNDLYQSAAIAVDPVRPYRCRSIAHDYHSVRDVGEARKRKAAWMAARNDRSLRHTSGPPPNAAVPDRAPKTIGRRPRGLRSEGAEPTAKIPPP